MGHTIPPKRQVIYAKLEELKCFAKTLRQPYRNRFEALIESTYNDISSIIYTNSLYDEEMIVYAMLARLKDEEKIRRCIAILLA